MEIIYLRNGLVKLTAPNGIIYIPDGSWYSEVVCQEKNIGKYEAAEADMEVEE